MGCLCSGGFFSRATCFNLNNVTYGQQLCGASLPLCASNITELYCLINSGSNHTKLCNGATILFGSSDGINGDFNFRIKVPNGVKITCPDGNCTLKRYQYSGYPPFPFLGAFESTCAFFNYELSSKVDIEGITFQDVGNINRPFNMPTSTATKALVGFDNWETSSADSPISVAITSKGDTFKTKKGKGHFKKVENSSKEKKKKAKATENSISSWNALPSVCILYNTSYGNPCPPILPACAINLNDIHCMVHYAPKKEVEICSGATIFFGTQDVAYYLTTVDKVKISCPTSDCTLVRRAFTTVIVDCAADLNYLFTCPFFTVDLNSHVAFEGVRFQEIYLPDPGCSGDYDTRIATKELVAIDNLKLIPEPLTIGANAASTRKGGKKGKWTNPQGKATLSDINVTPVSKIHSYLENKIVHKDTFNMADFNADGLVDCDEATVFLERKSTVWTLNCTKLLEHFTGSNAALGVSFQQFEDVGFDDASFNEIFVPKGLFSS